MTPTYLRPQELGDMLRDLSKQTFLPFEVVVVDCALPENTETEKVVRTLSPSLPFSIQYFGSKRGTAIQRNAGIDAASGDFIAFIDDDVRLEPDYFAQIMAAYDRDTKCEVAGIAGYIVNSFLDPSTSLRWKWYRRLHVFSTYEPGRYDYVSGYPINRYLQPPHDGLREIDYMGSNCGVWRRQAFDEGLRFDPFFADFGVLEDAHLSLCARRKWKLWECGTARCYHYPSPRGRVNSRKLAWKTAVNFRYVFMDIVPTRSWRQEIRFWFVQFLQLGQLIAALGRRGGRAGNLDAVRGKLEGIWAAMHMQQPTPASQKR
ncbi:MAG: glycosyltransferase [Bryobacterales bacterium]|nr:glycosyltransferase [Bryobacterales bacterium]